MVSKTADVRLPVGAQPYRLPPLSGLYRLRYHPPTSAASTFEEAVGEGSEKTSCGVVEAATGASASPHVTSPPVPPFSMEETHRRVHAQLLRSAALEDGDVDLFALYSVCAAEPVPCSNCTLHMDTTQQTCSYRLHETFTLPSEAPSIGDAADDEGDSVLARVQRGWYAFFFPMSECGRLKDNLLVCVNDALIAGDVAACEFAAGGVLRPLPKRAAPTYPAPSPFGPSAAPSVAQAAAAAAQLANLAPSSSHLKPLFYYVVSPVPLRGGRQRTEGSTPSQVVISVSWRSFPAAQPRTKAATTFTLLYSYLCAPRAPDTLTCRAQFGADARLRLVRSPNCQGAVHLKSEVTERSARLRVVTVDGAPLEAHRHPKDYTFQVCFYFGDYTGLMEETSFVAAVLVGAVALILLWFFLTKDLIV